ncbi:MAG: NAD-dependent epimerase/dehydratase family protein [Candidatus Omnitrophica bacterium]|nr:NAD-dependent epimerase/dehydratase family protein [Candidatus Omnitrophota bacterium]
MKKKVLICGATGFIGRNLVEHFAKNDSYQVFATHLKRDPYSLSNVTFLRADLTNSEDVNRVVKGMDIIIQAAATTSGAKEIVSKPHYHVTDNAVMNSLIFRAAYEQGAEHVVFFSCTVMYQPSSVPLKESDYNANDAIYPNYFGVGWTKVYIEKICEFYAKIGSAKYTVLRHSNIYGPHDKYDLEKSHVFGATITKVMTAEEGGDILVWGSGEEERDLLYIDDLVRCVETALEKQESKFELFNVGLGKATSIKDLVNLIISASGKKLTVEHDLSKPTIPTKLCLDCNKIKQAIGWEPQVTLKEGIKKTICWYKQNIA